MTSSRLNLDHSVDAMDAWVDAVMQVLQTDNRKRAYQSLAGTLPALRARLPEETASSFGRKLPLLVRGLYFNDPDATDAEVGDNELEQFFATVRAPFSANLRIDSHAIASAVFRVLEEKLGEDEAADVRAELPDDLQRLWHSTTDNSPHTQSTNELH